MEYLLTFKKEESETFEALWIGFKGGDQPEFGSEVKTSIQVEDELIKKSVTGGSIKLAICPSCGQRVAQHGNIRTIQDTAHFIFGETGFAYLKKCFSKWKGVTDELRRPFNRINDMLESAKPLSHDAIEAAINETVQ